MRRAFLVFILTTSPVRGFAALCSVANAGVPCAPDPGPDTDAAKQKILDLITAAQVAEQDIAPLRAAYIAIRGTTAPNTDKLAAAQAYLAAYTIQEQTYQKAMTLTADLYHVKPRHDGPFEIQAPSEPADAYVAKLTARWNPRVTESGKGVILAVKIDGTDGRSHYSGTMAMDPRKPRGRMALTTADGRVLILKETFAIARERDNPGYLARVLYHESQHFDRLSWKDKKGKRHGWQHIDKEEMAAYKFDLDHISAFGLKQKDVDEIRQNYMDYGAAVLSGVPLDDNTLTPAQEAVWKNHYENIQVNIEKEFSRLAEKVAAERARQEALQKRIEEERLARERQEAERKAREDAESERQAKQRAELYALQETENEVARCWYRLNYISRTDRRIIGFKDEDYSHYFTPGPLDLPGLKTVLLVTRACDLVRAGIPPEKIKACNDSAASLQNPMSYPLRARIDHANELSNRECVDYILSNSSNISDSGSFDKVVRAYQKTIMKKNSDAAKRAREESAREERERKRAGRGEGTHQPQDPGCSVENGVNGCPR
ncbi:MAG: hypothetical protein HYV14_00960 [Elusimicrobia bacterium]|nr:hypothetical protein [Elusimicrobiota bacterium]